MSETLPSYIKLEPPGATARARIDKAQVDIIGETGREISDPEMTKATNAIILGLFPDVKFERLDASDIAAEVLGPKTTGGWKLTVVTPEGAPSELINALYKRFAGLNDTHRWQQVDNIAYKGYLEGSYKVADSDKTADDGSVSMSEREKIETIYVSDELMRKMQRTISRPQQRLNVTGQPGSTLQR